MVRRDVLAGFHVITLCHSEYSGRSHSFAQEVLNNSVLCTLWLQDLTEIQPVDPVNLSGVQSEKCSHYINITHHTFMVLQYIFTTSIQFYMFFALHMSNKVGYKKVCT